MSTVAVWRSSSAAKRATALRCTIQGSGAPLLLVHGLGTSGALFAPLIPLLSQHYQVIIPDLRGHGQSQRLALAHSCDQLVEDLENLLNLLGVVSCAAIGHGDGCALLQLLAQRNPKAIDKLALISGYARASAKPTHYAQSALATVFWWLGGSRRFARQLARNARACEASYVRDLVQANDGARVAPVARSLLHFDSRAWLAKLRTPSLVLVGQLDTASHVQQARELARLLPCAELQVLEGAGHWLTHTHSGELANLLLAWLNEEHAV